MYTQTALLALIAYGASIARAHTAMSEFFVNGTGRGAGTCIRMNEGGKVNMFINPLDSQDMACGIGGASVVGRTCPILAGDTVSIKWRARPGEEADQRPIYDNHLGPCSVYMKHISNDAPSSDGSFPKSPAPAGDGWFKIMYDDKDDAGEWCTERVRVSKDGAVSVEVPSDLKSGYYLIRGEMISLTHARQGGPQVWAGCVQVYVSGGTGTAQPPTIKIPGHLHSSDVAMNYNVYTKPAPLLPVIGGSVYKSKSPTSLIHKQSIASSKADNPFACPAGTIMELGNACLPAYPTWTDTDKDAMPNCRAAQEKCFAIGDSCYDITNPAVNNKEGHGCRVYRAKCNEIKQACADKVMSGPVDAYKIITPPVGILRAPGVTKREVDGILEPLRRIATSFTG